MKLSCVNLVLDRRLNSEIFDFSQIGSDRSNSRQMAVIAANTLCVRVSLLSSVTTVSFMILLFLLSLPHNLNMREL